MRLFINSAALMDLVPDTTAKKFHLVRMNLTAAACPQPYSERIPNIGEGIPVVVTSNRTRAGYVPATGYIPRLIVAAGEQTRKKLMARGVISTWIWAEEGLNIQADDEISCEELLQKLQAALTIRESPSGRGAEYGNMPGTISPWICKVYPFENYFIYEMRGQKYRQPFNLDPVERIVKLSGGPTKVEEKFVDAHLVDAQAGDGMEMWPFPMTGLRKTPSICRPFALGIAPGSPNSEIMTLVARNWQNVREAVDMYLNATRNGLFKPLVPAFQPVKLSPDNKIMSVVTAAGIAPTDFVRWSCTALLTKGYLQARDFSTAKRKELAKSGKAMKDGSYPIVNTNDLKNAVQSFGRSPDKATKEHIIKRAKALKSTHALPDDWKVAAAKANCCKACGKEMDADATLNDEQQMHMCKACAEKKMAAGGPGSGRHAGSGGGEKMDALKLRSGHKFSWNGHNHTVSHVSSSPDRGAAAMHRVYTTKGKQLDFRPEDKVTMRAAAIN